MTREDLIQNPEYWKTLYENECERLGVEPILMFSKLEHQVIQWDKLTEDEKSELMLDIVATRKPIDEEELDNMTNKYLQAKVLCRMDESEQFFINLIGAAYKAGYRRALEK